MASSRTILKNLKNLKDYLILFHPLQQSTYFEKLIAEAFSNILYLPFYTSDNDDPNIPHRLTWQGIINPISKAPQGKPDAIAYCYKYYLIIEATRRTGANQWIKEFGPSIRHSENFCAQNSIPQKDVFVLMVCTKLFEDTYQSIKNYSREECKLVPIEVSDLVKILQASILAFTIKHLELRRLFHQISKTIRNSSSLIDFSKAVDSSITRWQKDVLKLEKNAFIGVKSYKAMRQIGRIHIGTSEILQKLQKHTIVKQYLNIIGEKISSKTIEDSLVQQSFASRLIPTYEGEEVFEPVPFVDFKGRSLRLIDTVMKIK